MESFHRYYFVNLNFLGMLSWKYKSVVGYLWWGKDYQLSMLSGIDKRSIWHQIIIFSQNKLSGKIDLLQIDWNFISWHNAVCNSRALSMNVSCGWIFVKEWADRVLQLSPFGFIAAAHVENIDSYTLSWKSQCMFNCQCILFLLSDSTKQRINNRF